MSEYKFIVRRSDAKHTWDGTTGTRVNGEFWEVCLPHQCDEWIIAGTGPYNGTDHAEAVEQLRTFIDEAQEALTALLERREMNLDA